MILAIENTDNSIYRLVEEISGVAHNLGTCFHIGGGIFLTCWHVLASHESLKGQNIQNEVIHFPPNTYLIGGKPERLYNLTWRRHWDTQHNQYFDIAAGQLSPGEQIPENLPYNFNFIPSESAEMKCRGYGESNGTLRGTRTIHYAGQDSRTCCFIMDNSLAPGYSGSPIFLNQRVVGIVCADNVNKSCSYGLGLNRIWHWLEGVYGSFTTSNLVTIDPEQDEISRYPLSINYKLYELNIAKLVDIALPRLKNINQTKDFIDEVNRNLIAVTDIRKGEEHSLIIEIDCLHEDSFKSFVDSMFRNAASKSSRTVGAILETKPIYDEKMLTEEEQRIVQKVKERLAKKCPQSKGN